MACWPWAMALLLRTSMERRNMRKFTMILLHLATTAMLAGVRAAACLQHERDDTSTL